MSCSKADKASPEYKLRMCVHCKKFDMPNLGNIDINDVRTLREETSMGMFECHAALKFCDNDMKLAEQAIYYCGLAMLIRCDDMERK